MSASGAIKETHGFTDPLTAGLMNTSKDGSYNPDMFASNMPRMYPIHRHIHIYSVARKSFPVKHVYFKGELKGCKEGERYVKCYSVPDPPQQISIDCDRGGKRVEVEPRDEAGWRVAIDILNPNNPSLNPYLQLDARQAALYSVGQNVDLIKFGLFPSLNDPPTEAELLRAEASRDKSYHDLVDEAFQEQASNPQNFRNWLKNNPDISIAMAATGTEADWFKKPEIKQSCPNCGDTIKAGLAFHKSSVGVLCIIDPERAALAGVTAERRGPGRPPNKD